jgi:glucokinase
MTPRWWREAVVSAKQPYTAGVDLGATKIFSLVALPDGREVGSDGRLTLAGQGPEAVIGRIVESVRAALAAAGAAQTQLAAVAVAAPGPVDHERGLVRNPPNLPGWGTVPIVRMLEETLRVPVALENDANAAALGEHAFGAGRDFRHMIFVTISSGVGGGIILEGRLYRGATGAAGEVGHMVVDEDGPWCGCGQRGCLEALASGTAIAARAAALAEEGVSPVLARLTRQSAPPPGGTTGLTAADVERAALEGDTVARAVIEEAGRYLGLGLVNLVHIFNPHGIVIGGGVSRMGDLILEPARQVVRERCFPLSQEGLKVVSGVLGDRAGALGAIVALEQAHGKKRATTP